MEIIEVVCRIAFGLQMAFWGLNGFFHWLKIPPSPPVIEKFVDACMETKFIMPTVKTLEILAGLSLVLGLAVPLNVMLMAPIVFVITLLHLLHNPKPWGVVIPITLPFAVIIGFHIPGILAGNF
ncbi:DoxX family membrane protein [Bdellovibrio sp. HCB209]|uniref:DoxX family membrane protein n=1 Tax=Bdellovibrio sp. HCB209 TaxID=3394354 RepID=UPI0039B47640